MPRFRNDESASAFAKKSQNECLISSPSAINSQMTDASDMELVRHYLRAGSEEAFTALVQRHINLVYSVAFRHVGNAAHAEEITQAVFILLARKAAALRPDTVLEGWLYETTRLTSSSFLRGERRRQWREQEAYMQSTLDESNKVYVWKQMSPLLDEAMARLGQKDRDAVILRFFKNKNLGQVAAALQITEAAAQKRVYRALEKLHRHFHKRGVSSTITNIADEISAHSIQAAPVALIKSISAVAAAKGAAATLPTLKLIKGVSKIMAWTKAKTVVVTVVVLACMAGGGAGFYAYHSAHQNLTAELHAALRVQKPETGSWSYPSEKVWHAVRDFGSNRAAAFPILQEALGDSSSEVRKQALSVMGMVGKPAMPQFGLLGEPSPQVTPILFQILNGNDDELSALAMNSLRTIGFQPKDIPALADLLVESHDKPLNSGTQQMQRYLPEVIAETISRNQDAIGPYVSSVENLLGNTNVDVRFGAACALAKYKGVNNPKISLELEAGLRSRYVKSIPYHPNTENLKHLMAIEMLQRIGPDAKPMVPALLEYSNSINDKFMSELSLRAAGYIDSGLRNTMPTVDAAIKKDPNWTNSISPW
jgi:RNA polymerase sigma factor (sigma-70 family)